MTEPGEREAELLLANLLARIHGDGGHHQDDVGTAQASADADRVVVELQYEAERLHRFIMDLSQRLFAADEVLARVAEKKTRA